MQASRSFLGTLGLLRRLWICEESLALLAAQSSTVSQAKLNFHPHQMRLSPTEAFFQLMGAPRQDRRRTMIKRDSWAEVLSKAASK